MEVVSQPGGLGAPGPSLTLNLHLGQVQLCRLWTRDRQLGHSLTGSETRPPRTLSLDSKLSSVTHHLGDVDRILSPLCSSVCPTVNGIKQNPLQGLLWGVDMGRQTPSVGPGTQ